MEYRQASGGQKPVRSGAQAVTTLDRFEYLVLLARGSNTFFILRPTAVNTYKTRKSSLCA